MKIKQIVETTTSGAIASAAQPMSTQKRSGTAKKAGSLFTGKKTKKPFYEGKMKELAYDLQHMNNGNFVKKYGKSKEDMKKSLGNLPKEQPVTEAEITEDDIIVVPGMRRSKDTSFIPHSADRRDHEVEMARSDLYATAKNAMRIYKLLKDRSEDEGLMGWQQSYITLAADYLNSVAESIEYNAQMKGALDEMTGGVIAGGMSNFEEGTDKIDEISDELKARYRDLAKKDKTFNQRAIDRAKMMSREQPHRADDWEDEVNFLQSVNKKRDRGLARAGEKAEQGVAEGLSWSALDEGLSVEDKMTIFEEYLTKGNLTESLDNDKKDYFTSLFKMSSIPVKNKKYIVVPLSIVGNRIMQLDKPAIMEFLGQSQDGLVFNSHNGKKTYPSKTMRDLSVFNTFTFQTRSAYNKFRTALSLKFDVDLPSMDFGQQGVAEGSDKLQGTPVVSLSDFSDKDYKKNKYGQTVPKKLKKDDPRVKFHKDQKPDVAEGKSQKCPKCGGELVSEEMMNEKKDACYYKVKSRYKVWPSAYASGALVKCRKKGAKNWGKSK